MRQIHIFKCAGCHYGPVLVSAEQAARTGDSPQCPRCGDRDGFQLQSELDYDETHELAFENHTNAKCQRCGMLLFSELIATTHSTAKCLAIVAAQTRCTFVVKDSGKREDFTTGARRDTQDGKGDFSRLPMVWLLELTKALQRRGEHTDRIDLVPIGPLLRLAAVYGKGAAKYGDFNWQRGIPMSRYVSSAMRHLISYSEGDRSEDHLAQAAWNCFAMIWTEEAVEGGGLPRELGDYGPLAEPDSETTEPTGLEPEPGGQPILSLRAHTPLRVLCGIREQGTEQGYSLVVLRHSGAVVKGWIRQQHLRALASQASPG